MAAPEHVPLAPEARTRAYESPDHVPDRWAPERPADLPHRQPEGERLGWQGPDQGYALTLAERFRPRLRVGEHEHLDDAVEGCLGIALRRASLYGRAPVVHDLTIAFTIWGWLDDAPPSELLALRRVRFAEVAHPHHYKERRAIAEAVPEATLRSTPAQVLAAYPRDWRTLLGV
jgi:hypothetical protein